MSLPFGQHDGLMHSEGLKEPMSLSEVLNGTTFVSAAGRVYRLFGNEDESLSLPEIPPLPPILAASKVPAPSLEDVLEQIGSFSAPTTSESEHCHSRESANLDDTPLSLAHRLRVGDEHCSPAIDSPTLQLFQALEESAAPRLVKRESTIPSGSFSESEIAGELSLKPVPKPKSEGRTQFRVVPDPIDEPFIVPFAKPAVIAEGSSEDIEIKTPVLKILSESPPPIHLPTTLFRKCWQHRSEEKPFYQKRPIPPPARVSPTLVSAQEEPPVVSEPKPSIDTSTFRWSAHLDSLMQSASNQIRMLADHLVVLSNQEVKAICFKSVFPGDGCSTILLCAVRALMERNYRILLIDAHHRHIDLPKQLSLFGNLDSGNEVIPLNDRLGLWVWQESKPADENRATLAGIVADNREQYDLILLDDGSVTESPLVDFVEFWNCVALEGVILVSNTKRPTTEMPLSHITAHIAGRLRQHHINLIGVTENYV